MPRRPRTRSSSTMARVLSLSKALLLSTLASSTEDVATAPTTVALETSLSRTSKPGVFLTLLVSTPTTAILPISLVPAEVASRRSARNSRASRRVTVRVKRSKLLPTARARALYLPVKCLITSGHKQDQPQEHKRRNNLVTLYQFRLALWLFYSSSLTFGGHYL